MWIESTRSGDELSDDERKMGAIRAVDDADPFELSLVVAPAQPQTIITSTNFTYSNAHEFDEATLERIRQALDANPARGPAGEKGDAGDETPPDDHELRSGQDALMLARIALRPRRN